MNNHKLFILYILVLFIDLSLCSAISVLAYFKIYYKTNSLIQEYRNKYITLGISAFCLIILIFIIPILYIQTCNIIYKKTTHQRYAYNKTWALNSRTSSESFEIRNSEEWSYSKNNMTLNNTVEIVGYCCWKRKKIPPSLSQTSNINEEPEQY